tara:strand:- start:33 stop:416 length:384 start_codon:yes stop_codon:yes gene_type:complete
MAKRTISWYDSDGNIKFVQARVTEGLEDAPESGLNFIVGQPQGIVGSKVVDGAIVNGTGYYHMPTTAHLRFVRNAALQKTDWTQAVDSPLSDSKKAEWVTYRQALRDLLNSYTDDDDIEDVVFPTQP